MSNAQQITFSVDKEKNTIAVTRTFAAGIEMVWDAWTKPELLDQWWAPHPYQAQTKSMDFREGGAWLYVMKGPKRDEHWCRMDYTSIQPMESYQGLDAFCDTEGNINQQLPRSEWTSLFSAVGNKTVVNILISYRHLSDLEYIIGLGFKEGFAAALSNLDQYLDARFKLRSDLRINNTPRVCSYLNFPGNTEEAFTFYRSVFRTEFSGEGIRRFGDLPANADHPAIADAVKKMVLHVELPIMDNHVLMATDSPAEMGFTVIPGNNMHISVEPSTREETARIFTELSAGANITMPLQDMLWGAYFGSLTDRYGINWMVNHISK